jgi:hypothetical protein
VKTWELLLGVLALMTGVWAQVKEVLHYLIGFVVVTRKINYMTANALVAYVAAHGTRSTREPAYCTQDWYIRPLGRQGRIAFECMVDSGGICWLGKKPIWVTKIAKVSKDEDIKYTVSFIRGTFDFEALLITALDWRNDLINQTGPEHGFMSRFAVHYHHGKERAEKYVEKFHDLISDRRLLKWKAEEVGGRDSATSFEYLALTPDLQNHVEELKRWRKSESWYKSRGIVWRRGYLYEGVPGTGKTSLVRAAGEELDMPVHMFDLASMSNEDLRDGWKRMSKDAPCIALIEDVDAVFQGRQNVAKLGGMMSSGGLTFDALLNCIDGVERHEGVLLIVTTNHPDALDPALTRGGRLDRTVTFGPLGFEERAKVALAILGPGDDTVRLMERFGDVPAAVFVEACTRVAMERFYEEDRDRGPGEGPFRKSGVAA